MRNKLLVFASLLIMASMVLASCAPAAPQTVVKTVEVVTTVEVPGPEGETVIVTATPEPAAPPPEMKSADPTTFTYATFGDPETLDPALNYETAGGGVVQQVYDKLVAYNREDPNTFVPSLAKEVPTVENGLLSADGLTYTFNIRSGVKFHDGTEMTPEDVAYSFQRGLLQGGTSSPQWMLTEPFLGSGVDDIAMIVNEEEPPYDDPAALAALPADVLQAACQKVVDAIVADNAAGTVTMHLAIPWAPFIPTIANGWGSVMSKAWVISKGGWDGDCATWQNFYGKTSAEVNEMGLGTETNGTGPYKLDHWTPGEEYVLTANEDYWVTEPLFEGGPTGAPAIKTVVVKSISEFSTRFAMLEAGDADSVMVGSMSDYPQMDTLVGEECQKTVNDCQVVDPAKPLRVVKGLESVSRTDMFFALDLNAEGGNNFIGSGKLDGNGIPVTFFSDPHVRKGFAYCFNYDVYLDDVFLGEGVRSNNVMLPGMIGYEEDSPIYTYDPDKCTEELQLSKWKAEGDSFVPDENGDISLWDTGFRFTAAYNTGNTARQTAGQILQTELSAVNDKFVVEVTGLPWPTFLQNQRARKLPIFFSGWLEDIHDPHNWVVPYTTGTYGGRQGLPQELKDQYKEYINAAVAVSDPAARAAEYHKFNQLWYEEAHTITLFVPTSRHYQQRWVQGWFYNPILSSVFTYYNLSKQ
ncbi:MAG: ABC transporter substrate-binding protein [Anaerolineales bacterium]|nr:ABC transporter substrate-binding protein [Anaerolineales bacterium]